MVGSAFHLHDAGSGLFSVKGSARPLEVRVAKEFVLHGSTPSCSRQHKAPAPARSHWLSSIFPLVCHTPSSRTLQIVAI